MLPKWRHDIVKTLLIKNPQQNGIVNSLAMMLSSTEKENEFSSRVPNCSRLFRFFRSKVD